MNAPPRWLLIVATVLLLGGIAGPYIPKPDGIPFVEPVTYPGAWIVMVEESAERSEAGIKFVADAGYHAKLASRGLKWKVYDDDSSDAAKARETAKTLPGLLIVAKDQTILANEPWPESTEKLDGIVKRSTGL